MQMDPFDDRVVVKPDDPEDRRPSGLIIPDVAQEKPQRGTVIAVGPGRWVEATGTHEPLQAKVGDSVLYSKYGGAEVELNGEQLLILSARDLLVKLS